MYYRAVPVTPNSFWQEEKKSFYEQYCYSALRGSSRSHENGGESQSHKKVCQTTKHTLSVLKRYITANNMRQMLFMGLAVGICRFLYVFTGLPQLGMITIAL